MSAENWGFFWGGGAKYFFSGPKRNFSFSLEIFILCLKISFSLENFNLGPVFLRPERGSE